MIIIFGFRQLLIFILHCITTFMLHSLQIIIIRIIFIHAAQPQDHSLSKISLSFEEERKINNVLLRHPSSSNIQTSSRQIFPRSSAYIFLSFGQSSSPRILISKSSRLLLSSLHSSREQPPSTKINTSEIPLPSGRKLIIPRARTGHASVSKEFFSLFLSPLASSTRRRFHRCEN